MVKGQVEELLIRYGKIDLLWFDGKPADQIPPALSPLSASANYSRVSSLTLDSTTQVIRTWLAIG